MIASHGLHLGGPQPEGKYFWEWFDRHGRSGLVGSCSRWLLFRYGSTSSMALPASAAGLGGPQPEGKYFWEGVCSHRRLRDGQPVARHIQLTSSYLSTYVDISGVPQSEYKHFWGGVHAEGRRGLRMLSPSSTLVPRYICRKSRHTSPEDVRESGGSSSRRFILWSSRSC